MKNHRFALKLVVLGFLILLLFIPQAMLMGLISERASWRQEAYENIRQSWPGAQTFAGPILTIPYRATPNTGATTGAWVMPATTTNAPTTPTQVRLIPKTLKVTSTLSAELRSRSIYEVPVYHNQLQVSGEFSTQGIKELLSTYKGYHVQLDNAQLAVLISDQRGVNGASEVQWGTNTLTFQPDSHLPNTAGLHIALPALDINALPETLPFSFKLDLRGMSSMNYALIAQNSDVQVTANWPHPKFIGELLPETRDITPQGFTAQWKATAFSYGIGQSLQACEQGDCAALLSRAVGVDLIQTVDVYQQSERSVKYAVLFIVLTFLTLILFELLKQLRIHPIQYTLVGLALTMFYLLLISLSEHIEFKWAYLVAALACVGLLTMYFGSILKSTRLGLILGAGLALLYGVLYSILQAEENSLLLGSLLLFLMLAALMWGTRHFDWYALAASMSAPKVPVSTQGDEIPTSINTTPSSTQD